MNESVQTPARIPSALRVAAGEDRFGEHRGLGVSHIDFKLMPQDSTGVFILEKTFYAKSARQSFARANGIRSNDCTKPAFAG
ncbi:MAG: hypothetical protein HZB51_06495 [Chloroflexi bacterium]|nr:hypothetical protein [Chloroflexota bacterium]